ncbi:MAG: UDP-3-O-acyl-N-acetylglucosamine deacetylase [Pseudomonadota bacterium]
MGAAAQNTLAAPVTLQGVGLHSGIDCRITVSPADPGEGVLFERTDLLNGARQHRFIKISPDRVTATSLGTTISNQHGVSVATIEHLMAGLALCGVDNAIIQVSGPEIPICDGSAYEFVAAFEGVGIKSQASTRRPISVNRSIAVTDDDRQLTIEPLDYLRLDVAIDFDDCAIGRQSLTVSTENAEDCKRLAASRTFCRLRDVEAMRSAGLIKGGSLENSIVVDGDQLLNGAQLRDDHEFALHKALDLIGDLYLLGGPIQGHIIAHKPGHDINNRFAREIARVTAFDAETVISPVAASA